MRSYQSPDFASLFHRFFLPNPPVKHGGNARKHARGRRFRRKSEKRLVCQRTRVGYRYRPRADPHFTHTRKPKGSDNGGHGKRFVRVLETRVFQARSLDRSLCRKRYLAWKRTEERTSVSRAHVRNVKRTTVDVAYLSIMRSR